MSGLNRKEDFANVHPEVARKAFRAGKGFVTSGVCIGYLQANIVIVHKSLADDFAGFCAANSGPLPMLYRSEVGQLTAPAITQTDTDISTDLPAYYVFEDGKISGTIQDLNAYRDVIHDYVTFYQGCSFSFEGALLAAGVPVRNIEQNSDTSAYRLNVTCHPVGPFSAQMITSMRPIPRAQVQTAFRATHPFTSAHGAPVHMGNPELVGVYDLSKTDYLVPVKFHEGDVPVFWACGITGPESLQSLRNPAPVAFSDAVGLYISDTPVASTISSKDDSPACLPIVVPLCDEPYWASVTSEGMVLKINKLEGLIATNSSGNNDLLKSSLAVSHASSVAITTMSTMDDDTTSGVIALTRMLRALGKRVDLLATQTLYNEQAKIVEGLVEKNILDEGVSVAHFPPEGEDDTLETAKNFLLQTGAKHSQRYDHLIAIDMAGKDVNQTGCLQSTEMLFRAAKDKSTVLTTVISNVKESTDLYSREASICDFRIQTTGTAGWGGYALASALYLLRVCPIHDRYRRRAIGFPPTEKDLQMFQTALPDIEKEHQVSHIIKNIKTNGASERDASSVSFWEINKNKLKQLLNIIN
ncbi:D-glutamate cyclase, mitochondrial-like isoform X2 [Asterias rubens]|nr:D-glutamate cyclase, mitochondrial-like isoform X2 [Asterias rubens]XP_033639125.1 D-glutamate cyclase, mitochondrial-like isoform X2 [Asterias rubens]